MNREVLIEIIGRELIRQDESGVLRQNDGYRFIVIDDLAICLDDLADAVLTSGIGLDPNL